MSQDSIAIIGNEGSGKTVFVAALTHLLQKNDPLGQHRIVPKDEATARYGATIIDQLNAGHWPASTPSGVLKTLNWDWVKPCGTTQPLRVLDCAGQDFLKIFAGGQLTEHQQKLSDSLHSAKVVVMLVNLDEAIAADGLSETRRHEIEFAPARALRALHQARVKPLLYLTQADSYLPLLETQELTNAAAALQRYLPQLATAKAETNTPVSFLAACETRIELVDGKMVTVPTGISTSGLALAGVPGNITRALSGRVLTTRF